ncbi:MAG TPA: hypothetical protein VIK56_01595 [Rhodoferax sp.]
MNLDYTTLDMQRRQHPAWRLLAADSAPLVASFGFVHNAEGRDSRLRNLSIEEYRVEKSRVGVC